MPAGSSSELEKEDEMKLFRYRTANTVRPGFVDPEGRFRDASAFCADYDRAFFGGEGPAGLARDFARAPDRYPALSSEPEYDPPVPRPGKVVAIGLNYADHARESGVPVPTEPVVFLKASHTVVGPNDPIVIPRGSQKTDWEVELGVVIGRDVEYLESLEAAAAAIAGFTISHDVSERHFQLERGGQWTKGKSCRSFNPLGPWLVTPDEVDCRSLALTLDLNGERVQNGSTATMVFDPFFIVHYLSQLMPLEIGDVISTGTPPGVGLGMKPPRYLKPGDVTELAITGLGRQRQVCRAAS
jgi:2,4-didehydro-3-deoxy-L-rhamnonate hydrolase